METGGGGVFQFPEKNKRDPLPRLFSTSEYLGKHYPRRPISIRQIYSRDTIYLDSKFNSERATKKKWLCKSRNHSYFFAENYFANQQNSKFLFDAKNFESREEIRLLEIHLVYHNL